MFMVSVTPFQANAAATPNGLAAFLLSYTQFHIKRHGRKQRIFVSLFAPTPELTSSGLVHPLPVLPRVLPEILTLSSLACNISTWIYVFITYSSAEYRAFRNMLYSIRMQKRLGLADDFRCSRRAWARQHSLLWLAVRLSASAARYTHRSRFPPLSIVRLPGIRASRLAE